MEMEIGIGKKKKRTFADEFGVRVFGVSWMNIVGANKELGFGGFFFCIEFSPFVLYPPLRFPPNEVTEFLRQDLMDHQIWGP